MNKEAHNLDVLSHVNALESAVQSAVKRIYPLVEVNGPFLEFSRDFSFGDVSTPVAMRIAKQIGQSPSEVAQTLCYALTGAMPHAFETPATVLHGYLNFSFSKEFLKDFIREAVDNPQCLRPHVGKGKTAVTDISHPNVAKPMGVHHLLSTVIGDSINRLLAYAGYTVVRDNYLGDWGTQFGKLIFAYRKWGDKDVVTKDPIPELLKLYVRFHEEAERDGSLEDKGRLEFKKLEEGDQENRKLWQWVVELSIREFNKIWGLLGVKFDFIHGESFYESMLRDVIAEGVEKKIFVEGERGALICEFPGEDLPPAVVRKADGATLYATRDLARVIYWETQWHPDVMINVVDVAQTLYFRQLFGMAERLGLTGAESVHVAFGRMRFPDRRMSTRRGNIVLLGEVIDEVIRLARNIVEEKNPALPEDTKAEVAQVVGVGALKFAVLGQNRETDTTFTWEKMLSLEGESAPYLQYAYARARSILRKAQGTERIEGSYEYREQSELMVVHLLAQFPCVVVESVVQYQPSVLARYLAKLGAAFNTFYASVPVLQSPDEAVQTARLQLVSAVSVILRTGLNLLGIEVAEKM